MPLAWAALQDGHLEALMAMAEERWHRDQVDASWLADRFGSTMDVAKLRVSHSARGRTVDLGGLGVVVITDDDDALILGFGFDIAAFTELDDVDDEDLDGTAEWAREIGWRFERSSPRAEFDRLWSETCERIRARVGPPVLVGTHDAGCLHHCLWRVGSRLLVCFQAEETDGGTDDVLTVALRAHAPDEEVPAGDALYALLTGDPPLVDRGVMLVGRSPYELGGCDERADLALGMPPTLERLVTGMRDAGMTVDREHVRSRAAIDAAGLSAQRDRAYEVLVTNAQEWVVRYPLIEPWGNFGSVDDDPPADLPYTSCRLTAAGVAAAEGWFPSLLINGAVGLLPHNAGEVARALSALLEDRALPFDDLLEILPGPDFPGGGVVCDAGALRDIYATGAGVLQIEASWQFEPAKEQGTPELPADVIASLEKMVAEHRDELHESADGSITISVLGGIDDVDDEPGWLGHPSRVVITELPYGVFRGGSHGLIADISRRRRSLPAVKNVYDDSSRRRGTRIMILLRGDTPDTTIQALRDQTAFRVALEVDMRVIVDATIRRYDLRQLLLAHVDRRRAAVGARQAKAEFKRLASDFGQPRRTRIANSPTTPLP